MLLCVDLSLSTFEFTLQGHLPLASNQLLLFLQTLAYTLLGLSRLHKAQPFLFWLLLHRRKHFNLITRF